MNLADRAALQLCVKTALMGSQRDQVASLLQYRPWPDVARFCAYSCQYEALALKPWQHPPCWAEPDEASAAGKLLRRMRKAGISKFHPDPLAALGKHKG